MRRWLLGAAGVGVWAASIAYWTNYQKRSSPLVRDILFTLRHTRQVREALGDDITPGLWFSGTINQVRVRGSSPCASSRARFSCW